MSITNPKAKRVKVRKKWTINPKTRVNPDVSVYDRQREKRLRDMEMGNGDFRIAGKK